MKKFTLLLFMGLLWSWTGSAQVPVGEQEGSTSLLPISSCFNFSYSQQLLYQSEINAVGDITSISFYFESGANSSSNDWSVYLGHTSKDAFSDLSDWVAFEDLTQVFSGIVSFPEGGNQMLITFTTPFSYNNVDNLVLAVDENAPGFDCSAYFGKTGDLGATRSMYFRDDNVNPNPATPPAASFSATHVSTVILGGIQQACSFPTNLETSNTTTTTADITWTENGSATEWEVVYGLYGFDPLTEGSTITADATETTLTDLQPSSRYEFYVKAICGDDDESELKGPASFNTDCVTSTVPYYLPFETGANCTSTENLGAGQGWKIVSEDINGFTGTYARYYFSVQEANAWIFTNAIELTAGVAYEITYTYGNNHSNYTENMKVAYGTSNEASGMITDLADHTSINDATPHTNTVQFTVATTDVYYFGFQAYSGPNQYYLHLDNIEIVEASVCEAPSDLMTTNVTEFSADLSWTPGGNETQWKVVYGLAGFEPATEGETVMVETTPETTLTGLDAGVEYEFYVTAICDVDDESEMVGPLAFTTEQTVGTTKNEIAEIKYFPNPVSENLTITAANTIENITVFNLLGQAVMEVQPKSMNVVLDLSSLSTGTYVLKANAADSISTFKVVKK